jgi:hypothetical protein
VEIFTTDGINFSAKSANETGRSFALTINAKLTKKNATIDVLIFFILIFNVPNNKEANYSKY